MGYGGHRDGMDVRPMGLDTFFSGGFAAYVRAGILFLGIFACLDMGGGHRDGWTDGRLRPTGWNCFSWEIWMFGHGHWDVMGLGWFSPEMVLPSFTSLYFIESGAFEK